MPISDDQTIFLGIASQHGYPAEAALHVYEAIATQLGGRGLTPALYVYRSGERPPEGDSADTGSPAPPVRPRTLLAFATADTALGYAQRMRLQGSPRVRRMHLAQLLAVMLQQPGIVALCVADEPLEIPVGQQLPAGLLIQRDDLHEMLKGATHGEPL